MELTVHRDNLERALTLVERVTSKNSSLPILNNILLKTGGGRLIICATNLEIAATVTIGAKVKSEGSIAVPAHVLTDVIRSASSDTVLLKVVKQTLTAEVGQYQTSILCFDPTEYPIIPTTTGGVSVTIPTTILHTLCTEVADSIALSDARPELAGAYLHIDSKGIVMTATDGFRLTEHHIMASQSTNGAIIIPRNTIAEMIRSINNTTGDATIQFSENQCAITIDDYQLTSRLIDGKYPDYQKVIPEQALSRALVSRSELENAIKVAALFSSSISDVKLECSEKRITVSGKNSTRGEGKASVEVNLKGEPFEISLNYHYLLDGLKVIPDDKVVLEFTGKGSPFIFRPTNEQKFVYLIMPLRGS